jgi:DNA-binding NarL/FixJ family response regulator
VSSNQLKLIVEILKNTVRYNVLKKKRVLLADDHQLMLAGLTAVLSSDFDVVGAVTSGREVVLAAQSLRPDFIVMDIGMPGLNGIEAARQLQHLAPQIPIIFVTQQLDGQYIRAAFEAGARAYVTKHSAATELLDAVDAITAGSYYVTPLAPVSEPDLYALRDRTLNPASFFAGQLTARQREVLQLVAEGKSAKEISAALNISLKTVEFHKKSLMDQLGLRTTAELTRYALTHGIVAG